MALFWSVRIFPGETADANKQIYYGKVRYTSMLPYVKLVPNPDGTFDIYLKYDKKDAEFAHEWSGNEPGELPASLLQTIRAHAKKARIRSIKIFASGVLISSLTLSSFLSAFAASDHYVMGYLYHGTEQQYYEYVEQTGGVLDTVAPSYFNISEDGSLVLNHPSPSFISQMHARGLKVVPFLSNHWNRTAGINALKDVETLSSQIAAYVEEYNLDGVNVDIENVTHEQKDQYTELVRLLREKLPEGKELSVAVAANPNNWQVGWHGSYDYAALAEHADYLMLMAYDEHFEGGEAGPVASLDFVERSIQHALSYVSPDKLVLGIPLYGRVWSLDNSRIIGKGTGSRVIQDIVNTTGATVTYDETAQAVRAEFTITESSPQYTVGSDFVLLPGRYTAWYDDARSYQAKLSLIEKYGLKGAGSWALGQEDPSIWENYENWMQGVPGAQEPEIPGADSSGGVTDPRTPDTEMPDSDNSEGTTDSETPDTEIPDKDDSTDAENYYIYTVRKGDTLWKIAQKLLGNGKRYPEIMALNGLASDTIYVGMQLKIPGAADDGQSGQPGSSNSGVRSYSVKSGDTLWKIAETHLGSGRRYLEIMELNGLSDETIYPGQVLRIPKK